MNLRVEAMASLVRSTALSLIWGVSLFAHHSSALAAPALIPLPVEVTPGDGVFSLTDQTVVVAQGEAVGKARQLVDALSKATGYYLHLASQVPDRNFIHLKLADNLPAKLGDEGYTLKVTLQGVSITAR